MDTKTIVALLDGLEAGLDVPLWPEARAEQSIRETLVHLERLIVEVPARWKLHEIRSYYLASYVPAGQAPWSVEEIKSHIRAALFVLRGLVDAAPN